MKKLILIFSFICCGLQSFKMANKSVLEFKYPKKQGTTISLSSEDLKIYKTNWKDEDYYYFMKGEHFEGCVCYYKMNNKQKTSFLDSVKASLHEHNLSSIYPYLFFKSISWDKRNEMNETSWGKSTEDFMFRQCDVKTYLTKYAQKIMYGYCMFNDDILVSVKLCTLGRSACSSSDSTEMRNMMNTLAKEN